MDHGVRVWLADGVAETDLEVEVTIYTDTTPSQTIQRSFSLSVAEL